MDDVTPDTPQKKRKVEEKRKYASKFNTRWTETFSWVKASRCGAHNAFCKVCNVDVCVQHGGKNDLVKHAGTAKHKANIEGQRGVPAMESFLIRGPTADLVTRAECKMAMLIAKNNLPVAFSDEFSRSVGAMFPDSEIAKKYSCGRTKTTQIIKGKKT